MKLTALLILLGVISIAVSACSSDADDPTATVEPSATVVPTVPVAFQVNSFYLDSLENNAVQVTAAFARIDEQLSKVWPVKSSLFDAMRDSNAPQEMISSLTAILQLSPPDEFEQDHQILQNTVATVVEYSRELEQSLQDRDLVEMMVKLAKLRVSYQRMLLAVSPQFCSALGIADDSEQLCEVRAGPPGTYDADVEQLLKIYRIEFVPRVSSFPAAMSEEERFDAIAALNVEIEIATQEAVKKLAALSPPEGRAEDHGILLTFLEDTSETASAITAAGTARDDNEIQRLFEQSGTILESAGSSISCEYSETLLHGWFSRIAC